MPFALSQRSLDRCKHVAPELVAIAKDACGRSEVDFGIDREQTRDVAEQARLKAAGRSKTMASRHLPTRRDPATGRVEVSTALDLVAWVAKEGGGGAWEHDDWRCYYAIAAAMRLAAIAAGKRLRWGGVWDRCLNDLPAGAEAMRAEVAAYVARRKAAGKAAFIDGPHFELLED